MRQLSPSDRAAASSTASGYVPGLIAGFVDAPAQVILHAAPPPDRPLRVRHDGPGVSVWDGTSLVAHANLSMDAFESPPPLGAETYATSWRPSADMARDDGFVRPEFVWAALGEPGGLAGVSLRRLAADLRHPVTSGEAYLVVAWPIRRDREKHYTGSALYSEAGELLAVARAVWIA
jgi:hypothetical protein